jgi:hypothetical protein
MHILSSSTRTGLRVTLERRSGGSFVKCECYRYASRLSWQLDPTKGMKKKWKITTLGLSSVRMQGKSTEKRTPSSVLPIICVDVSDVNLMTSSHTNTILRYRGEFIITPITDDFTAFFTNEKFRCILDCPEPTRVKWWRTWNC